MAFKRPGAFKIYVSSFRQLKEPAEILTGVTVIDKRKRRRR